MGPLLPHVSWVLQQKAVRLPTIAVVILHLCTGEKPLRPHVQLIVTDRYLDALVKPGLQHTSTMYLRQASTLAARRATAGSVRRMATGKDVKFGVEGRALMLQGVDMLADAVQVRV